jgi:hypothetical protein
VRAEYDQDVINAVLDSEQICHVAWVEDGEPRMVPMLYFRDGGEIFLHGNRQSATLKKIGEGALACITVTRVDGIVVARSGFHCSMNYRSVTLFGRGRVVGGDDSRGGEKRLRLDQFVERLIPGHLARVREPTPQEIAATLVIAVPIDEASAKIRGEGAIDADADLDTDVWAGVIPVRTATGLPLANADLRSGIPVPGYVASWSHPDDREA